MSKYLFALYAFLLFGCKVTKNPDYGSRDIYRTGMSSCFPGGTSTPFDSFIGWLLFFILLTAVIAYHFGKKNGGK